MEPLAVIFLIQLIGVVGLLAWTYTKKGKKWLDSL